MAHGSDRGMGIKGLIGRLQRRKSERFEKRRLC